MLEDLEGPDFGGVGCRARGCGVLAGVLGAAGVAAGEVLGGLPLLEILFAAPTGVDEVPVRAVDGAQEFEPLEAVAGLDCSGASGEASLEGFARFR